MAYAYLANNPLQGRHGPRDGTANAPATAQPLTRDIYFGIVLAATLYQTVLCFIHTQFFSISGAMVGGVEFLIYAMCFLLMARPIRLEFAATVLLLFSYLLLLALLRSSADFKGFRDLIIPILFYAVGRRMGDIDRADRYLKVIVIVVLFLGLFEMLFLDIYSKIFNIFSYYGAQGSMAGVTNWAKDSLGALNSIRPEGIGRTLLPSLLGSKRVSSIFIEPISLGNFATIIFAWGLAKERAQLKLAAFYMVSGMIMIVMADSRYGSLSILVLTAMRLFLSPRFSSIAIVAPLVAIAMELLFGVFGNFASGDGVTGRLYLSGGVLLNFGPMELLGLQNFNAGFGDGGYAYSMAKFGLVMCLALWIGFWMIKMRDDRGLRFRAYVAVYMALLMLISGSSFYALKTAGLLWFLVGCCAIGYGAAPGRAPAAGVR